MTAGQEIEAVVKTLSKGLKTGLAAKIKVTFSAVEQLIKVLEDKQCVKVLNISKIEYTDDDDDAGDDDSSNGGSTEPSSRGELINQIILMIMLGV